MWYNREGIELGDRTFGFNYLPCHFSYLKLGSYLASLGFIFVAIVINQWFSTLSNCWTFSLHGSFPGAQFVKQII
jgi:hypothetical protein